MTDDGNIIPTPAPQPTPATPPPAPVAQPDDKWRGEYFKTKAEKDALESKHGALLTEIETLKAATASVPETNAKLLRIELAYKAGVPQHLLTLVTANSEAEIKEQIKAITESLMSAQPATPATPAATTPDPQVVTTPAQPQIPLTPTPSGRPGESWMDKYTRSTPEERQKMDEARKEQGPAFVLN